MRPSCSFSFPPLIPSGLCLKAPLGPACSPLPVVKDSVTMAPYFSKDSSILFSWGYSGVELVVSLGLWDSPECISLS